MADPQQPRDATPAHDLAAEIKSRAGALIDGLVHKADEVYEAEFVHLLTRVRELVDRKLRMEGAKTDTRDFLGELLFTRLRRGMHLFLRSEDDVTALRAAEWVMGALFSMTTLSEFAKAFDQSLIKATSGARDFNFAGRTDFISVEEVMQMLASGGHRGCLSLEKGDNRLDIYLKDGRIWFLDPHHVIRRVLPGDSMRHREIPDALIAEAEGRRVREGVPTLVTLHERGAFKVEELRDIMRMFGKETLFDFMREREPYAFYYRKLDELPAFAEESDLRLGVTSVLLEGSKQLDDWRQMLVAFPDPDAPIQPSADMYARLGDAALGVLEIKLLSLINGDTTPRSLVTALGVPLYDVYQLLVRLSQVGILASEADPETLGEIGAASEESSVQTSMREAFEALDANDDAGQRRNAIDRVFGGDDAPGPFDVLDKALGGDKAPLQDKDGGDLVPDLLDILRKGKKS